MHMVYAKQRRQRAIAELIQSSVVTTQQELAAQLEAQGFRATQATISRDLEQIGAIKVRRSGRIAYGLATDLATASGPRFETLLREYARSIAPAGNLVVIRTPPGSAHLIGVALDQSDVAEAIGNICGDDTMFVACESDAMARTLSARLNLEIGRQ